MARVLISDLKTALAEAAKSGPHEADTAAAAIAVVKKDIEKLRKKGFSDRQIVELLRATGVRVSMSTLAAHLRPQNQVRPAPPADNFGAAELVQPLSFGPQQ